MAWTSPPKFIPGRLASSADLNTYVRDNPDYLIGPRVWTAVTYQHSWLDFGAGYLGVAYRMVGDRVHFRGLALQTAAPASNFLLGVSIFTLPVGFRPRYQQIFSVLGFTAGSTRIVRVDVATTGVVSASVTVTPSGSSWVQLEGIFFDLME